MRIQARIVLPQPVPSERPMPSGPSRRSNASGTSNPEGPSAQACPLMIRSKPLTGLTANAANSFQKRVEPEVESSRMLFDNLYSDSPKKNPPQVVVIQSFVEGCSVSRKN